MTDRNRAILLEAGEGRAYELGAMKAVFKADEDETGAAYSISEWWLEPHSQGPGAHSHEANDDIFYVIEGTMTFFIDGNWTPVGKGGFVRAAPGVVHDFRNDGDVRAGVLNIYVPGGFEREMAGIVQWFAENGS